MSDLKLCRKWTICLSFWAMFVWKKSITNWSKWHISTRDFLQRLNLCFASNHKCPWLHVLLYWVKRKLPKNNLHSPTLYHFWKSMNSYFWVVSKKSKCSLCLFFCDFWGVEGPSLLCPQRMNKKIPSTLCTPM